MLEATLQSDNCFCTLTYSEENIPDDLSVSPREISLFVKRLRKAGYHFRYFAVGEYGDNTFRPHYHIALFGFPTCAWGITRKKEHCCDICTTIKRTWGKGEILLGLLEPKSSAYIAGYVNKKMTAEYDERLEGRRPEFARMSLRPGIGHDVMYEVASTMLEFDLHKKTADVPHSLQHGTRKWPLGQYLRRSLRTMVGKEKKMSPEAFNETQERMRPLRESAFNASRPLKEYVLKVSEGRRIQIHANEARKKKVNRL